MTTASTTPAGAPIKGRPWLQTLRGLAWCADAPEAFPYDVTEIAHALSHLARVAGQTQAFYCVGDHSVRVAAEVASMPDASHGLMRMALLHDAAEAFCVDMPAPLKRLPEMAGYRALIKRTEVAIAEHFELFKFLDHPRIQRADMVLLATEKRDVLGPSPHDDDWGVELPLPLPHTIVPRTSAQAKRAFLDAWQSYGGAL